MFVKTTINVKVNKEDLSLANNILKSLGLSMNEYINMAIKELIVKDDIPFELEPSKELLEALQEGEDIINGKIQAKGYQTVYELIKDLESDI